MTAHSAYLEVWSSLSSWEKFIVLIMVSFVAAKIVEVFGIKVVKKFVKGTETDVDNVLFDELHTPLYVTIALMGIYLGSLYLEIDQTISSQTSLGQINFFIQATLLSAITVIWARAFLRIGKKLFTQVDTSTQVKEDFAPIFENLWTFFIIVITIFLLLTFWRVNVTPLLASAGIAGIAIGFAAKDTIANFFGSIALYFDDTYKVGDYIVLDSGEAGTVMDVSIRSTMIKTRDDVIITVPNSVLNSARIINESAPREKKRVKVPVGVAYGTDIDKVEDILLDIAKNEELVLQLPEPRVRFREFGGSALKYELLCWVEEPLRDNKTRHRLNREIYRRFNEEDITIPFPQREINVRTGAVTNGEETVESPQKDI